MESDSDNTFLSHFYMNTNTDSSVLEYEYKTDSNSYTHSYIYLIWKTTFSNFFIDNLQLQNHV
jgi:hypothetical protein